MNQSIYRAYNFNLFLTITYFQKYLILYTFIIIYTITLNLNLFLIIPLYFIQFVFLNLNIKPEIYLQNKNHIFN